MSVLEEQAKVENGTITSETPIDELRESVLSGDILILKSVFDADELRHIRQEVFDWGTTTDPVVANPEEADSSFHRIDNNPEESGCPHNFHSYNFIFNDTTEIEHVVQPHFDKLRNLQNDLAETEAPFNLQKSPCLHPQVIHYPAGGGGFSMHSHPFLPQKMGMILSLSDYGEDFKNGGTRFATPDGDIVDIEGHHTIGDIAIFRYDLPHQVTPCDPDDDLRFDRPDGRWSMILPYY